jgi:hypothetical protein
MVVLKNYSVIIIAVFIIPTAFNAVFCSHCWVHKEAMIHRWIWSLSLLNAG